MLFEYIKDLTVNKKGNIPLEDYIPFLINRWLSFVSPSSCLGINESVNMLGNIDKMHHYKLLLKLFPKSKQSSFIKYVKKVKEEKTKEDDKVDMLACNMEVSRREMKLLLELKQQYT